MRNNNQSNRLIKWMVMVSDFFFLNAIILLASILLWEMDSWPEHSFKIYILVNNIALMLAMLRFSTIIHLRLISISLRWMALRNTMIIRCIP